MSSDIGIHKVINLPCTKKEFYRLWLTFLTPLHHLTPKVIEIAAELLRHRQELSKVILDEVMLTKVLLSQETRDEIIKDCDITLSNFHVAIGKLKKAHFFKDGVINPRLIPQIPDDSKDYNLALAFHVKDE